VPGRLLSLSGFAADVARHFFRALAPGYDVRQHLAAISMPTLGIVGQYDWLCPPAASRALALGSPAPSSLR
jgi:proline iminopeptidase